MELSFNISDGTLIKGLVHKQNGTPAGVIILVHGLGEHFGRYSSWANTFVKAGYEVIGADLPGHGLSGGRRGHIRSYRLADEIIDRLLSEGTKRHPGAPVFLYGHSLGGGIVLRYLLKMQPDICGAIVTSPWLRLSFEPGRLKLLLAMVVKRILPGLAQPSGLIITYLSRDKEVVDAYINDSLVHSNISVSLFNEAVSAATYSLQNGNLLGVPLLLLHGASDSITSPKGSRDFAGKSDKVELKVWDSGYHELHNDIVKDEVSAFIVRWLQNRIKSC